MVDDDGNTFTGTVSGATYALFGTFPEDGGITSLNINFTLTSATSGSGNSTWTWTDGVDSCIGDSAFNFTIYVPPGGGSSGGGGGGCFISTTAFDL